MDGLFNPVSPLQACLDPGEKLLWSGQPKQGVRLQATDLFMIPFSLMWGGFAIFWEATVLGLVHTSTTHLKTDAGTKTVSLFMALWGVPFVLVGLYMIVGRFFGDAASRRKTWYGVTDRRLVIQRSLWGGSTTSFDYATLTNLNLNERGDGSGDIVFGQPMFDGSRRRRGIVPGFYQVPAARIVYNQIREAQQRARK